MKSLKISILVFASMVAACFMGTGKVQAQEFTIQGDLVSSYVWRGFYQTGASFQPTLGFGVGDFSLTAWGSTDFDGVSSNAPVWDHCVRHIRLPFSFLHVLWLSSYNSHW